MDNLNTSILSKISLPVPPKSEQDLIVKAVSEIEKELAKIITLQFDEIRCLEEYKQVIVSSAVTGKIKI